MSDLKKEPLAIPSIQDIEREGRILGSNEEALVLNITKASWSHYARIGMAAVSAIDWLGSLISVASTLSAEEDQSKTNKLIYLWVKEHELKLIALSQAINGMFERFDSFGERVYERIVSEEYLSLVRKTFQYWDKAETEAKRDMYRKLITNAGGVSIVEDDLVRIFIDWIEKYNELHFSVISQIHNSRGGITRKQIWVNIKGRIPSDSSADADLFKLLMDELAIGRVIRQKRVIDRQGRFLKSKRLVTSSNTNVLKTPFDDTEKYELTDLGQGFVRYVLNELNEQLETGASASST